MRFQIRPLFLAALTCGCAAPAWAECASPVAVGDLPSRQQWAELERFEAPPGLNPLVSTVQSMARFGVGAVNNDFYAITVDGKGEPPAAMADFLRRNIDRMVFQGSPYSLAPYDAANGATWNSARPMGALMSFVLAKIPLPSPMGSDVRASVVTSCAGATSWIFSTAMTPKDGWHPVSGNRSFGVTANPDGSLRIWTKGADRAVSQGTIGLVHTHSEAARDQTFLQGHAVWVRLLDNLSERLRARNPRDRTEFSVRRPYP
jgi:hypothetical protein